MDDNPKLYCGTYGKYNNGSIKGKWMDLTEYDTVEAFFEACAELHKDEDDPEFMFQDFECFPKGLYSESLSKADLAPILEYAQLSDDQREMVEDFMSATGEDFGTYTMEQIEDSVEFELDNSSHMSTEEQLGYHYAENGFIDIPENVYSYFDFERYGDEMMNDLTEGDKYVFNLNKI